MQILLVGIGILLTVFFLIGTGGLPAVDSTGKPGEASHASAYRILKQFRQAVVADAPIVIAASVSEWNHFLELAAERISGDHAEFSGRVIVQGSEFTLVTSRRMMDFPFAYHLVLRLVGRMEGERIEYHSAYLGRLPIPRAWGLSLLESRLADALGRGYRGDAIPALLAVRVQDARLALAFKEESSLAVTLPELAARIQRQERDKATANRGLRIREYLHVLCEFDRQQVTDKVYPLAGYFPAVFTLLQQNIQTRDAMQEHAAALLALAVFFGNKNFEAVTGPVRTGELSGCKPARSVVLRRREDLARHFVTWAGLQVLSDGGIPHAIGEFKEIYDTRVRGTGFSFADMAANRAGIRFAEFLLSGPGDVQLALLSSAPVREDAFFPSIKRLPEGITGAELDRRDREQNYRRMYVEIEQRIDRLELYRSAD